MGAPRGRLRPSQSGSAPVAQAGCLGTGAEPVWRCAWTASTTAHEFRIKPLGVDG